MVFVTFRGLVTKSAIDQSFRLAMKCPERESMCWRRIFLRNVLVVQQPCCRIGVSCIVCNVCQVYKYK